VGIGAGAAQAAELAPVLASLVGLAVPPVRGRKTINLLPPAIATKLAFRKRQPLLIAAAALVAASLVPLVIQSSRVLAAARTQVEEVNKGILPLQAVQSKITENIEALDRAKAEILAVQSLAESKNNWINFFSDLQDRLVKVEDVWLESLQVLRAGPSDASAGGLFGAAPVPEEPQLDADGNPVKPVLRLQVSGRLLDRNNPVSRVSPDSYERVKSLLASFVDSQFISAVEKESFDANTPGILRFDFILVIDPARPL
jgi:type IV pilus assembly protein PilM